METKIKVICNREDLVTIADAVRSKTNSTKEMSLQDIATNINKITGGEGVILPTLTNEAVASDLITGKQLIDADGNIVNGTMPLVTLSAPSITVNSNGLITATASQTRGYISAGTKSSTQQLTTQGATTITPTKSTQVAVASGKYTTGTISVNPIPSEYITTTDATAAATDILAGETAYVDGSKVTGTIPRKTESDLVATGPTVTVPGGYYASQVTKSVATTTQATPSVSINNSGLITATATQSAGYVTAGTKSGTKQLTTQAAKTITPTKSEQTAVAANVYTTGAVKVAAIPSEYITTTDATAVATDMLSGKTAYVKGSKVTGTMPNNGEITNIMDGVNVKSIAIPAGYTSGGSIGLDNTIDNEVSEQANLIAQIIEQANNLPDADSGGGGIDTSDATATAGDILSDKTAYVNGVKITGNIATKTASNLTASGSIVTVPSGYYATQATKSVASTTQATPSITINASGLITATVSQTAGWVAAGSKSATQQLAFQAAKTITPSTTDQVAVSSGYYTGGNITVKGDSNLIASNIKNGVSIFGVEGTHTCDSGLDTSDATATAECILMGETAYVNGIKITGTIPLHLSQDQIIPTTASQIAINNGYYTINDVVVAGDENLIAENIKSGVSIFNIEGTYEGSGGSTENYEDELLSGDLTTYTNNNVTDLRTGAFFYCTSIKSIYMGACKEIGQSAFVGCANLTTASFNACVAIASSAFLQCTKLKNISFPNCTSIYWAAFSTCTSLNTVDLPACTYLGGRAFQGCTNITSFSLPKLRYIYSSTFQSCKSLATISLPSITVIGSTAFGSCTNLSSIYLMGSSLCTLSGSSAFTGAGITSTNGSIYVPASLVDAYKAATNWAFFANRIFAGDSGAAD